MNIVSTFSFCLRKFSGGGSPRIAVFICWSFCLVLAPASAYAWGQATHAYFVIAMNPEDVDPLEIYGAVAPDLFNLMIDSPDYDYLVNQTHRNFKKVFRKSLNTDLRPFAFGFISHNDVNGADFTAHHNGRTTLKGYVIAKSRLLAPKLRPMLEEILKNAGIPRPALVARKLGLVLAHPLIETGIDILVKRNEDPSIGLELSLAAQGRPSSIPDLLISAYAKGFVRHMDISHEEASDLIRGAEFDFQQLIIRYGEILTQGERDAIRDLADQGGALIEDYIESALGKPVDIDTETLVQFIQLAIEQVEDDYAEEISKTLAYLKRSLTRFDRVLRGD